MTRSTAEPRHTVLVALDGSPAAATAVPLAQVIADQLGANVEILHVAAAGGGPEPEVWRRLHLNLRPGDEVQVRSNVADPVTAILRATREPGVEIVVLTTHGRVIEPGRSLGRVAEKIAASTGQPVLLVRPEAAGGSSTRPLRRLLLPVDGSTATATALSPVVDLARRLNAGLTLLYVVSPDEPVANEPGSIGVPSYVDQPHYEWPAWRERMIAHLSTCIGEHPSDLPIEVFLTVGSIATEITRVATEHPADAVVLARRSHMEIGRAQILRAVLDHVPCPVLLVAGG